ncbi:MAG: TonB-dependent receptor, partial [Balneolales bacterium]|nr:TonB-dependent receptor [Balneolales bacterium]
MKNLSLLTIIILAFLSVKIQAQSNGSITGLITDATFQQPLAGANIVLEGTSFGTSTNYDGEFTLKNIPGGEYSLSVSYIGFTTRIIEIEVRPGTTEMVNIELQDNFLELDGITVQGIRQGQAAALNQQKTAVNIKNVVASDLIGRFPDQNVADALRRIPAISIQQDQGEARYVQIRGTNPNLSNITINGEQVPSPEGSVRFVALDMIPSDVLSSIEVNKAITPDMDGDAIGGSVNLNTLSVRNRRVLKATIAPGYNNLAQDLSPFGGLVALTYGDRLMDGDLGFLISSSYNNSNRASNNNEMEYDSGALQELQLRDYELNRERWGSVASVDYQLGDQSMLFANMAFNYFTDTEFRRRFTVETDKFTRELKDRLERQKIFTFSAGGEHALGQTWKVDYMFSYAYADQNTPYDRNVAFESEVAAEDVVFDVSDPDYPQFSSATTNAYNYSAYQFDEFEESSEFNSDQNYTARLNLTNNYTLGNDISGELKFGGLVRTKEKERSPDIRIYGYDGNFLWSDVQGSFEDDDFLDGNYANGIGLFPDPDALENFFENNRGSFDAEFESEDSESDSEAETYDATENTFAGYLMTELRRGNLSGLIGARYEFTDVEYSARVVEFNEDGDYLGATTTTGTNDYSFFLPMIHLTYQITPLVNVRAAWTNSFAKPNYFDLAPYRVISREDQEIELGNPALEATTSMNFDLLGEYYFNSVGIISAGVFYKQISDFIYVTSFDFTETGPYTGYQAVQPVNGGDADLAGFEINLQQQLTFLPGFATGFGVYANYTYSWSEAELTSADGDARTVSLPGQAENTGNFALSYEKSGFSGRVALSYAGSFIDEIRDVEGNDRIYDEHFQI